MKKICKECGIEKELTEFYKHPQWVLWTLPRCKECIKKWRRSEREREMARVIDKKRVRPKDYQYKRTLKYRIISKEKYEAHKKVWNYLRKNKDKYDFKCVICWKQDRIEKHHEDYNKPNEIIPFCSLHHKRRHCWDFEVKKERIIILPF